MQHSLVDDMRDGYERSHQLDHQQNIEEIDGGETSSSMVVVPSEFNEKTQEYEPATKRRKASYGFISENVGIEHEKQTRSLVRLSRPFSKLEWHPSSSSTSPTSSSHSPSRGRWLSLLRRPLVNGRKITSDIAEMHYQLLEESQKREDCERDIAAVKDALNELQQQNDLLRQETHCLQSDNAILIRQLEDHTMSLSSLTFDAERYKSCLEEHSIPVPQSLYDEVLVRTKIPRINLQSDALPDGVLHAAGLTSEEKANFSSLQALVNTVNELQVRLRNSHVSRSSTAEHRIAELKDELAEVQNLYNGMKESHELMKEQFEEEIKAAIKKNDALNGKLATKELEIGTLTITIDEMKAREAQKIEELKVDELEERIASLSTILEETNLKVTTLRSENSSLTAAAIVNQKELEYYHSSLTRERQQSETLRAERDSLYDDINSARTLVAQHSTETVLLQSRVSVLERTAKSREEEVEEWRKRVNEAQQRMVEEQDRWNRALKESVAKVTRAEMSEVASHERASLSDAKLLQREKELMEIKESHACLLNERDLEIQGLKSSIASEILAKEFADQRSRQLENELKISTDERQILASRLESVESQASILKNRHPQLNFGVMENELRLFESEKIALITEVEELRTQLVDSRNAAENRESLLIQLRASMDSQKASVITKEEEIVELKTQVDHLKLGIEKAEHEIKEASRVALIMEENLNETKKELETKKEENLKLNIEMEAFRKGESESLNQLKLELEHTKHELAKAILDVESIGQGHRLEIQAHFRDLQRLESLEKAHQGERERFEHDKKSVQEKLKLSEGRLLTLSSELIDTRRKAEIAESQRRQIVDENEQIRRLLHDKLDNMELSDDEMKTQFAEQLRIEETLKREADQARVTSERLQLEISSSNIEMQQLRSKIEKLNEQVEQLQEERDQLTMPSAGTFVNGDQQTRLISDLQLRVAKLESELKHVIELKRNTERRFNELVSETEPLRRREALLQGELASVKNLLEVTEKDVATYKNKYLELTKGLHQDLEAQKVELEGRVKILESKKRELETSLSQANQSLTHVNAERLTFRNEVEKLNKEILQMKSQTQTLQTQLETIQTQQRPQIDNVEIQKRYQVQLSNFRRLVQELNGERDRLRSELSTTAATLAAKESQINSIQEQLQLLQQRKPPPETFSPSSELLSSLGGVLDEAVKVGILSTLVASRLPTHSQYREVVQPSSPSPKSPINKSVDAPSPRSNHIEQESQISLHQSIPHGSPIAYNPLLNELHPIGTTAISQSSPPPDNAPIDMTPIDGSNLIQSIPNANLSSNLPRQQSGIDDEEEPGEVPMEQAKIGANGEQQGPLSSSEVNPGQL